ncbi:hypothetical protein BpHYR1_005201 [Brachionus plicatilis]|uniref:Uncharacterized protein n=1 Tax=Brachionus plicatilis TaxID=10195 RepID=A0A3M7PAJ0_BRAPC|nr:hypothetical protein BpHYR1_005201 [Brachionus plicatilis]
MFVLGQNSSPCCKIYIRVDMFKIRLTLEEAALSPYPSFEILKYILQIQKLESSYLTILVQKIIWVYNWKLIKILIQFDTFNIKKIQNNFLKYWNIIHQRQNDLTEFKAF